MGRELKPAWAVLLMVRAPRLVAPVGVLKPELAPTVLTEAWVNSNYGEILRRQLTLAAGSKDSALVLTLEPGAYTCRVAGAGTSTGVALVEVYLLP